MFYWAGELKKGIHTPLISEELFVKIQEILKRCNKPFISEDSLLFYPVFKKPFDIMANFSLCSVRGE
jgi:hypothetical protein